MDTFGWAELVALLTSIGFGIVSAVVPIVNAEAYVIASQVSAVAGPDSRSRSASPSARRSASCCFSSACARARNSRSSGIGGSSRNNAPVGPARARFRAVMAKLLDLVGQNAGGCRSSCSPPSSVSRRCTLSPCWPARPRCGRSGSGLTVFVGRLCRFLLVASGFHGLHDWFV